MGKIHVLVLVLLCAVITTANASVSSVSAFVNSKAVLQRDKPVPISGKAVPGEIVNVSFNGQSVSTTADSQGNWQVTLASMSANATSQNLTITATNTLTYSDVLVGDVWICSGQSNMAFALGSCNRSSDVSSANFPGIRQFTVTAATSDVPTKTVAGSWAICSPSTAGSFSAVAFYFARKVHQESGVPIGLIVSAVGSTAIDTWLDQEGVVDIPTIQPILSQSVLPKGPFCYFNGMIYPVAPFPIKGALWYQGEDGETTVQSPDSYYLKMKALVQGWRRLWGGDDLAFYYVQIANWSTAQSVPMPNDAWAVTRDQQTKALAIPHTGMAVAIDLGESGDIHPKDKLDVGERLALWALKNDYGQPNTVASGPILKDAALQGSTVVCSFDNVGSGLMVGSKTPYQPTQEMVGGTLQRFSIAGADGVWYWADATINGNTVVLSSTSVPSPRKVAYAYAINPSGCNLYNKEGLPASPFYVDDVTVRYNITASASAGGSITPAGTTSVLPRSVIRYTITPDSGHYIQDVKVDGVSVGPVKSYIFDPVYPNHSIEATFSTIQPSFTVNTTALQGGSFSPSGNVSVAQGETKTFDIVPDYGCKITGVTVDGFQVGPRNSFTFVDVSGNHTISATFVFTIKSSCTPGGGINPNGTFVVNAGDSKSFTMNALGGYTLIDLSIDGVSVPPSNSYTFSSINAGHTIAATFGKTASSIADFKTKTNNSIVQLNGPDIVVYAPKNENGTRSTNFFYIAESRYKGGLRVLGNTLDSLSLGNKINKLIGYVRRPTGKEPYLDLIVAPIGSGSAPILPVGMNNKSLLTDAKVQLSPVKVWGRVKAINDVTSLVISDGFSDSDVTVLVNGVEIPAGLDTTKTVVVTGLLNKDDSGRLVLNAQDIESL